MADNESKKTVNDDMRARRCFYPSDDADALTPAIAYLGKLQTELDDFGDFPFAGVGVGQDDDGNVTFDPEVYNDSHGVMIGTVKKQGEGVKAIFMAPIPNFPANLSGDEAFDRWALSILEKEANHVAVRPLRTADNIEDVIDQMPRNADAYTTSSRGISAGVMGAFNELYKAINATLASKVGVWARARLTKNELKSSLESSAYALEYHNALEDRGEADSLFVVALQIGINAAKKKGLDPTIFERWLETRDQKPFTAEEEADEDFDLDSLTEDLLAEDDEEADGAADSATEPTTEAETEPAAG